MRLIFEQVADQNRKKIIPKTRISRNFQSVNIFDAAYDKENKKTIRGAKEVFGIFDMNGDQ